MGLFGFLKRTKPLPASDPVVIELRIPKVNEPEITPDQLRRQLFDAAATGDEDQLCLLCQAHEKSIFEQGMIWSKVPPEIRSNPVLLRWYGNGLRAIARFCADRLGKPELMEQIKAFDVLPGANQKKNAKKKDIKHPVNDDRPGSL
jgi:hypothetical protein